MKVRSAKANVNSASGFGGGCGEGCLGTVRRDQRQGVAMTRMMRRAVFARGTASSLIAIALLVGGCGGGEDAANPAAPSAAAPEAQAQVVAEGSKAAAQAADVR